MSSGLCAKIPLHSLSRRRRVKTLLSNKWTENKEGSLLKKAVGIRRGGERLFISAAPLNITARIFPGQRKEKRTFILGGGKILKTEGIVRHQLERSGKPRRGFYLGRKSRSIDQDFFQILAWKRRLF